MKQTIWGLTFLLASTSASVWAQKFPVKEDACEPTTHKEANKLFQKAQKAESAGEQRQLLKEATQVESEYYEAHFQVGMKYFKLDKWEAARFHLEEVIRICPQYSAYPYYALGIMDNTDGKYESALKHFKKFMEFENVRDQEYEEVKAILPELQDLVDIFTKPVPFNPSPVLDVSTPKDEYLASISPDNRYFYFIRKEFVKDGNLNKGPGDATPTTVELFFRSERKDGKWTIGQEMGLPFNEKYNNGAASITADNKHMYFVICLNNQTQYCDIWESHWESYKWGPLKNMGTRVNSDDWDSQPTISFDGNTLIFSSMRAGGLGGSDLWMCTKLPTGEWSAPVNLGPTINTPQNELTPFLHSDSQTLYFSSKGHKGMGGYDIFYSKKGADGNWTKPKNIGFPINSEKEEVSFFVSLDGKTGYYSSDKLQGPGGLDVYSFELHPGARPEEVLFVEGKIDNTVPNKKIDEIEIKNMRTNESTQIKVDTTDGSYVAIVTSKDDYLVTIKKEDVAFTSALVSKETVKPGSPTTFNLKSSPIKQGESYRLNDINFATNSAELSEKTQFIIREFVEFLKTNPSIEVEIQGHTDSDGNDAENLTLSERRAQSVFNYLVSQGIESTRLRYKGFGETKPVASNSTMDGKAKNRRTEFVILKK